MRTMTAMFFITCLSVTGGIAADSAAGAAVYSKSCKGCHGAAGVANPSMAKMMKVEMKDLGSADVQAESDAEMKAIITKGKGKMKPMPSLTGAAADNVIAYVRTLKK